MSTDDELTLKAAEDARLLDAARDMLEALKEAEFVMDDCPMISTPLRNAIFKARKAIAKAEGKQ